MAYQIKECRFCGARFSTETGFKTYCSEECKKKNKAIYESKRRGYYTRKKQGSDLSRLNDEARANGMNYGMYVGLNGL